MTDLDTFRAETRQWLEENCPAEMRKPMESEADTCWGGRKFTFQSEAQKIWLERMAEKGWTVPTWAPDYGGAGLSKEEAKMLAQEMKRIGARSPHTNFGIWMLGPALLKFGSEEQKREHLPKIARGEIRWCQGYSEPNAGSDLASLATRAEDKGDHYLINGQKIWTSYADKADWIFCLVRTDFEAPKHLGISFILFDMASEGVSTKPIKLISGASPFCETFFDDVKAPKGNLVHEAGRGWDVAKYLLTHEREMISEIGSDVEQRMIGEIAADELGRDENGRMDDPVLRAKAIEADIDAFAFKTLLQSVKDRTKAGQSLGALSSALKYYGTELNKRRFELMMDVGGSDELELSETRNSDGQRAREWLRTKANSIEGGTSEVQLNIVSKHILRLPGA
ncbi:MAG: acyl-CoA dehydrogenase family protein [Pseudomonadota bacterium]